MTRIFLIRHAEAEGNLYRRAQGQYDSNITSLGRAQISALAERFRDVPLDALWVSDLHRTQSTASAIRKYHPDLQPNLTPRLREIDVGVWEDVAWGNIAAEYPCEMVLFTHDPARWSVPGGEPYEALYTRMRDVMLELGNTYPDQTVAVVSHGLAIRCLLCHILGITSEKFDSLPYGDNSSVSLITAENGDLHVEWYNDASHLDRAGLSTFARQTWRMQEQKRVPVRDIYTRYEPLDPGAEGAYYTQVYADTWQASHGSLQGFVPSVYLASAKACVRRDPRCLMKLYMGDEAAGVIQLDPDRGAEEGAGWISLLYVDPRFRGRRLGIQLVGHAVSYFRRAGRTVLRLHTADDNKNALGFYEHNGFRSLETVAGAAGQLHLMEADISPRILTPEEI